LLSRYVLVAPGICRTQR